MSENKYQVIVGNIGTTYEGSNKIEAVLDYSDYVAMSKGNIGRAGGEPVTLMEDGEIIKEHYGFYRGDF